MFSTSVPLSPFKASPLVQNFVMVIYSTFNLDENQIDTPKVIINNKFSV